MHVLQAEFSPYELAELRVLKDLAPSTDRAMDLRFKMLGLIIMAANSMDASQQEKLLARAEGLEATLDGLELTYGIDDNETNSR